MVMEGTLDEVVANVLMGKIVAINQALKAGQSEDVLEQALVGTEEELQEALRAAAASMDEEEDDYL